MSYLGYLFWKAFAELSHGVLLIFRVSFIKVVLGMWLVAYIRSSAINLDTEPVF